MTNVVLQLLLIVLGLCRPCLAFRRSGVLRNGLAPPRIEHIPLRTQFAPRCQIDGRPLNLLFILDSSGSLSEQFEEERQVVKDILRSVTILPEFTRVALVQYSGIARTEFNFNVFNSPNHKRNERNVLDAVDSLRFINGITKTGNALRHSMTLLTEQEGWRPYAPTIVFLISDGRTYDDTRRLDEQMAAQIRALGADIYAYGTGEYAAVEELFEITGYVDRVFSKSRQKEVKKHYDDMMEFFRPYDGVEICEEVPICVPGSTRPMDLLFVVDGSGSLTKSFEDQINFVSSVIAPVNVHPDAVRVALIQYSSRASLEFGFARYFTTHEVEKALDNIRQRSGTTNTDDALRKAYSVLKFDPGRRHDVPSMVVVLTDGHSRFPITESSEQLLTAADYVYAIALNPPRLTDIDELFRITQDWNKIYTEANASDFKINVVQEHFSFSCPGMEGDNKDEFEPIVRGPVDVTCSSSQVSITALTRLKFEGRLYAIEHYNSPGCFQRGTGYENSISLEIPGGKCGIERTATSDGYQYKGSVMLQFHPDAVTKVDQILDISCFHRDPTARTLGQLNLKIPKNCHYSIRKFAPDGCLALDARVGEGIYHNWECDNDPTQYGFLVHNCYVEGNDNTIIKLSDSNGCALDEALFGEPNYLEQSKAHLESSSFRLPAADNIRFRCTISFCDKAIGGCDHIVPPQCAPSSDTRRQKRQAPVAFAPSNLPSFEVTTRWITVLDNEVSIPAQEIHYCSSFLSATNIFKKR